MQQLEAGISFDGSRRQLLLGMRDHILKVNPHASLSDAYLYARLALEASEKYPSVDPLLLLAIGTVESGYDPQAKSHADARGLYQIWPSTGRLLRARSAGTTTRRRSTTPRRTPSPRRSTSTSCSPPTATRSMVLAEYNGGPLNAGYFRADVGALAAETRSYVPRVLELYARLKEQFEAGPAAQGALASHDDKREGKSLGARTASLLGRASAPVEERAAGASSATAPAAAAAPNPAAGAGRPTR